MGKFALINSHWQHVVIPFFVQASCPSEGQRPFAIAIGTRSNGRLLTLAQSFGRYFIVQRDRQVASRAVNVIRYMAKSKVSFTGHLVEDETSWIISSGLEHNGVYASCYGLSGPANLVCAGLSLLALEGSPFKLIRLTRYVAWQVEFAQQIAQIQSCGIKIREFRRNGFLEARWKTEPRHLPAFYNFLYHDPGFLGRKDTGQSVLILTLAGQGLAMKEHEQELQARRLVAILAPASKHFRIECEDINGRHWVSVTNFAAKPKDKMTVRILFE